MFLTSVSLRTFFRFVYTRSGSPVKAAGGGGTMWGGGEGGSSSNSIPSSIDYNQWSMENCHNWLLTWYIGTTVFHSTSVNMLPFTNYINMLLSLIVKAMGLCKTVIQKRWSSLLEKNHLGFKQVHVEEYSV